MVKECPEVRWMNSCREEPLRGRQVSQEGVTLYVLLPTLLRSSAKQFLFYSVICWVVPPFEFAYIAELHVRPGVGPLPPARVHRRLRQGRLHHAGDEDHH